MKYKESTAPDYLATIIRWVHEGASVERDGFFYKPEDAKIAQQKINNGDKGRVSSNAKRFRKLLSNIVDLAKDGRKQSLGKSTTTTTTTKKIIPKSLDLNF